MPLSRNADPVDPDTTEPPFDPWAWDPDPVVVVSRRPRVLYFPPDLLLREPTEADVKRWTSANGSGGGDIAWSSTLNKQLALGAGVTFLGAYTSSWAYHTTAPGHAPKGPPPPDKMLLVQPYTFASATMSAPGSGNVDPETRRLLPHRVHAALRRVLDYHEKHASPHLFRALDGHDAPEVMVLPLSEVFSQRTERGQQAHTTVLVTIPHLRANRHEVMTPLGALHDYAIKFKTRAGDPIVTACRQWAARKKIG